MKNKAIFIAATGQNVGKTTISLGVLAGLQKRYASVGFIKPIGQQLIRVAEGFDVDKDVVLFKEYFGLQAPYNLMSPVTCPIGFTRDFLDEKISEIHLHEKISTYFKNILNTHEYVVVEGTGHVGVGSLLNLNNAQVAKNLGLDIVLIGTGGVGSCIDELALNISLCQRYEVPIRGIILNKVFEEKQSMILEYVTKWLKKQNIPLIGCIPYLPYLSTPTMNDYESLFGSNLISGHQNKMRHFQEMRLVAGSLESFLETIKPNELIITPACREDILFATLERHFRERLLEKKDFGTGMILTGKNPPRDELLKRIQNVDIPILYAPYCSFDVMKMLTNFTAKTRKEDTSKIKKAIDLVERHLDFDLLCSRSTKSFASTKL